jgi:cellobiose phosphorylase
MTFFEQYSYKQKNYALLLIAVLLVAVSYKRAFKITLETLGYKQELTQKIADAHHAVSSIRTTQRDIAYLNKLLGKENSTIEKVQQGFLDFLEKNSSNVIVYQVDEVLNYKHPDFSVNTHRIILKGGFLPTLRFLSIPWKNTLI